MAYVLLVFLLVFTLVTHEAAHAYEMHKRGVEIKSMGIGQSAGRLSYTIRSRIIPFPVTITPLLLGAQVNITQKGFEKLRTLSLKDQATCYAAGVFVNVVTGFGLMLVGQLLLGGSPLFAATAFGVSVVITALRRYTSLAIPVVGLAVIAICVILPWTDGATGAESFGVFGSLFTDLTIPGALFLGGLLMAVVGVANMMPLVPLDGSQVVNAVLDRMGLHRASEIYIRVTIVLFWVLCVYGLVTLII